MPLASFINLPNVLIKNFLLIRVQNLPDPGARFRMNCLELRIDLLLQILVLLRGIIENLAELLPARPKDSAPSLDAPPPLFG